MLAWFLRGFRFPGLVRLVSGISARAILFSFGGALGLALAGVAPLSAQAGDVLWGDAGEPTVGCTGVAGSVNVTTDGVDTTVEWSEVNDSGGNLPGGGSAITDAGCTIPATNFTTDDDNNIGGVTNSFLMGMDASDDDENDSMQLEVTFDPALIGLSFRLADIDAPAGSWTDLVLVEAFDDGNSPVLPTVQTLGDGDGESDTVTTSTTCPGFAAASNRCYIGINANSSPNSDGDGNVILTYGSGSVASVRLTYFSSEISGGENPDAQWVGVGAFSWTNTLPVVITSFDSERTGGETVLRWTTEFESFNAGFRVLGLENGRWREVEHVPAGEGESRLPQRYEVAIEGHFEQLAIEDIDLLGRKQRHGPFRTGRAYGEEPQPRLIDWQAIKARGALVAPLDRVREAAELAADPELARARANTVRTASAATKARSEAVSPAARILVAEPGLQKLTYEGLLASGVDFTGVAASKIAVTDRGRAVTRYVGGGSTFGPGSWIEFVAEPVLTAWSPVDVYVLSVDSRLVRSSQAVSANGTASTTTQRSTFRHEQERRYSAASPNGDPWFDANPQAGPGRPALLTRTFDLPDLVAGTARLNLDVWGGADHPGGQPDHHIRVLLNGVALGDHRFDGIVAKTFAYDVSGLLVELGNSLVIELPGDTGFGFDIVHLDGFVVDHQRETVAQNGRFAGLGSGSRFAVAGLGAAPSVGWLVRGSTALRFEFAAGVPVIVPGWQSGAKVWVAQAGAELAPGVEPGLPASAAASGADYVIVAHPSLSNDLDSLVALQESRGFDVKVATTDTIYAAYSDHQEDPNAIARYLASSAAAGGARYVLLVGATTYDPYDHLGLGSVSLVPTQFLSLGFVRFSPTDEPLVDFDRNGIPDAALGRLPVRTADELASVVDKLWAFAPTPDALLTSGASPIAGQLPELNSDYAAAITPWQTTTSDVDTVGTAAVKGEILGAFGPQGPSLVSFVGHSSPGRWDFTPVLRWQDVATLTNTGRPVLVTQWGCWNAYYVAPDIEDMSTNLLLQPDVGAVGAIGATTLTNEASHQALGATFFAALGGGAETVGEAWLAAKRALATSGAPLDALYGMALLGDPGTPLPPTSGVKSLPQSVWTRAGVVRKATSGARRTSSALGD